MVKLYLITGFLGSGKTTLLNNLLNELSAQHRIAIIQNEFAPSGVDSKILKQNDGDFKLIEINNGSIFCLCQLHNFEKSIKKLLDDYNPEIIFIETSGLADPISIVEIIQSPILSEKISLGLSICIVDAAHIFNGLHKLQRVKHQIMVADIIILNKTELIKEKIEPIKKFIYSLNPFAKIIPSTYSNVQWRTIESHTNSTLVAQKFVGLKNLGRPQISVHVLRVHEKTDLNGLKSFINTIKSKCFRVKGFVNLKNGKTVILQSVFEQIKFKEVENYSGRTEIIAFGYDITFEELRKEFINVI